VPLVHHEFARIGNVLASLAYFHNRIWQ